MLPYVRATIRKQCAVGVVVYLNLASDTTINYVLQHVKVLINHKWLAAGELDVSYIREHTVDLLPEMIIFFGPRTGS
jgi:hypothetical protein